MRAYVLRRQGVAPDAAFRDVLEAAEALGGIRSDFAVRLRVEKPQLLERLQRQGVLVAGKGIPEYATFLREEDISLLKAAKDVRLTKDMKHVLGIVAEEGPISRPRLVALSDLSPASTLAALRRLLDALCVTLTPDRRIRAIPDPKISRQEARKEVLRRLVRSVGVTSAEALSAYTRFEYNMGETRALLRAFEREGWLVKGFLARGERTVYWILRDDLDAIETLSFRRAFVLTPMDNLFLFLRAEIAERFHSGYCYVIFSGTEMVGSFKARRRRKEFIVTDFEGDPAARQIVDSWKEENDLAVHEDIPRISDHEVMEWYAKMYGRGADR